MKLSIRRSAPNLPPEKNGGVISHTIVDEDWGYSIGYVNVVAETGAANSYCVGRRDVRFEMPQGDFASLDEAVAAIGEAYAAGIASADAYAKRILAKLHANGMKPLIFEETRSGPIVCRMNAAFADEYVYHSVEFDCTPQEALNLLDAWSRTRDIMASCVSSRYSGLDRGFLGWFSYGGVLSIGVGADPVCGKIASIEKTPWSDEVAA